MMWRNQHKIVFISLFLISAIFLLTCGAHAQAGKKVAVFVSIPPQKYFLQQIGAQRVDVQVMTQAHAILKALSEIDPDHRAVYEANTKRFVSKLAELDDELKKIFADKQGLQFLVFHPSWGYFARSYGLQQMPVEIEGKDPKPAQLKRLIEHAKKRHINIIFVQPQFSSRSAERVAKEIGGQVIFADPLAFDWEGNLREVAAKFKTALR